MIQVKRQSFSARGTSLIPTFKSCSKSAWVNRPKFRTACPRKGTTLWRVACSTTRKCASRPGSFFSITFARSVDCFYFFRGHINKLVWFLGQRRFSNSWARQADPELLPAASKFRFNDQIDCKVRHLSIRTIRVISHVLNKTRFNHTITSMNKDCSVFEVTQRSKRILCRHDRGHYYLISRGAITTRAEIHSDWKSMNSYQFVGGKCLVSTFLKAFTVQHWWEM